MMMKRMLDMRQVYILLRSILNFILDQIIGMSCFEFTI